MRLRRDDRIANLPLVPVNQFSPSGGLRMRSLGGRWAHEQGLSLCKGLNSADLWTSKNSTIPREGLNPKHATLNLSSNIA